MPHEPLFHNKIMYLEDCDFTKDGRLSLPSPYNGKISLVMMFASWCGHCQKAKEHFSKIPELLGNDVVVCVINGSGKGKSSQSEQDLMKRVKNITPDFRGFPHIVVFGKDGKLLGSHEGQRTAEEIVKTVHKYSS